jgi:hypothetical protein
MREEKEMDEREGENFFFCKKKNRLSILFHVSNSDGDKRINVYVARHLYRTIKSSFFINEITVLLFYK